MRRTAKQSRYVTVGYEDKVVFTPTKKVRSRPDVLTTWQRSQGLWKDHPVFRAMTATEVIEWLRGEDCDVEHQP